MSIGLELVAGSGRFSKLETVSHGSRTLSSLESLNLSHNELVTLSSDVFCGLRHLRRLRLEGNRLQSLGDRAFYWLDRLEELNLERNLLTDLDWDVFDCQQIYSSWNPYDRVRVYSLKRNLLELKLGGNRLTALPDGLFNGFRKLRTLQLQSNQLKRLPQQLFQTLGVHWAFLECLKSINPMNPALQSNRFQSSKVALSGKVDCEVAELSKVPEF